MKRLTFLRVSASVLLLFVAAATAQEKKMDDAMHKHMMQMMQDSTVVNMMMDHIAKDAKLHMQMMHKMMAACKSDSTKMKGMKGMCKMMMNDKDHSKMKGMMHDGMDHKMMMHGDSTEPVKKKKAGQ